jgi:hypothetical protein
VGARFLSVFSSSSQEALTGEPHSEFTRQKT